MADDALKKPEDRSTRLETQQGVGRRGEFVAQFLSKQGYVRLRPEQMEVVLKGED